MTRTDNDGGLWVKVGRQSAFHKLIAIRDLHQPYGPAGDGWDNCRECDLPWPCPTRQIADVEVQS